LIPGITAGGETIAGPGGGGGDFENVGLLLNFDGTNGQTTFTDLSTNALTITQGSPDLTVTTTNPKFGTGALLATGGASSYLSAPVTAAGPLDFPDEDFAIEFSLRIGTFGPGYEYYTLYDCGYASPGNGFYIALLATGRISVTLGAALGVTWNGLSSAPAAFVDGDVWQSIAVTREGNVGRLFIDGVLQDFTSTWATGVVANFTADVRIGQGVGATIGYPWAGAIDELRVTKGDAVRTANYTPESAAFPTS
jgi:hypothetical protein